MGVRTAFRPLELTARAWCRDRGLTEMRLHNVGSRSGTAAAWDALGFEVVEQVRVLRFGSPDPTDKAAMITDLASPRIGP